MELDSLDNLKSAVLNNIESAQSHAEELSKHRKLAYDYYYQKPFGNEREGRSQYISPDVMQSVDYVKYMIMDALTSNRDMVRLDAENEQDVDLIEQADAYVQDVLMNDNNGYKVLYDAVHDGLLLKTGIVKRYWKESSKISKEYFEGLNEAQLNQLLYQGNVEPVSVDEQIIETPVVDPFTGQQVMTQTAFYSGEVEVSQDTSHVCVESVPPEEFLISKGATSLEDADFVAHYRRVSKADLLSWGYDQGKVDKLSPENDVELDAEQDARNPHDNVSTLGMVSNDLSSREYVTLHECYIKVDVNGQGRIEIYKVDIAGNEILDYEEVSEYPFEYWTALPVPHQFTGLSMADVSMDAQFTNSQVKRALTDYMLLTSNPRFVANTGLIDNVRDLIDNRIGATISVSDVNAAVQPLNLPQINPAILSLVETIEQDKERNTGLSRMAQGVDPMAFSAQNHRDTISQMTKAGSLKPAGIARNFVEMLYKPLIKAIYRLARENDQTGRTVKMAGKYSQINPQQWPEAVNIEVSVALTSDDGAKRAQMLLGIAGQLRNDPQASELFGASQTYKLYKDAMKEAGIVSPFYLENPDTPEYQQKQMQAMKQQLAQQQEQMQILKQQLQLTDKQITLTSMNSQSKLELDRYKHDDKMSLEREKQDQAELMDTHQRRMDYEAE